MVENSQSDGALRSKALTALGFFSPAEAAAVQAAMARILPDDELGPGAIEASALYYLDRALTGAEAHLQGFYRSGVRQLDEAARTRFGASFAECTPVQQDDLIEAMARDAAPAFGRTPAARAFFEALRSHTIEGIFCDPVHGGNRNFAGWKLLGYPGPQPSYSHEEQQLDAEIIRDRIYKAADYPLPSSEDSEP